MGLRVQKNDDPVLLPPPVAGLSDPENPSLPQELGEHSSPLQNCSQVYCAVGHSNTKPSLAWVPVRSGAEGNEMAGSYAKSAATGEDPVEEIPERYADETSLSHMTRAATEARSRETADLISAHVRPER